MRRAARFGLGVIMFALTLSLSACDEPSPAGIAAISPANAPTSAAEDWSSFWTEAQTVGGYQGVHVEWDVSGAGNVPAVVTQTEALGPRPVVVLGISSVLGDEVKKAQLEAMLTMMLTEHQIPYLGLGNEVDYKPDTDELLALVDELAVFIHALGTPTQVFTVFQFEHLLSYADPQSMFAAVSNVDLVAFTSYPFLKYSSPAAIPDTYYVPITTWTTKPIAFTELAWPSRMNHPGFPTVKGSEGDQVSFIHRWREVLTAGFDVHFANWYALHDTADWYESDPITNFKQVFASCGLMRNGNEAKPALEAWSLLNATPVT